MSEQSIVLSVHPQYVEKILSGEKKYEFRKIRPKREINKLVIYATSPQGKVLAMADIERILSGTPEKIWHQTHKYSGVTKDFFQSYFYQRQKAFAIKLTNIRKIDGIKLQDIDPSITPPQSFLYLSDTHIRNIEQHIVQRGGTVGSDTHIKNIEKRIGKRKVA